MGAASVASLVGFAMWAIAYGLIIWKGFRDRSYGVPLVAICLNVTWELYFALLCPLTGGITKGICTASGPQLLLLRVWLLFDLVIVWQLFRFGWTHQLGAALGRYFGPQRQRRYFSLTVGALLALALVWQYAFLVVSHDEDGNELAWITNFIMSALFVRSALTRPNQVGLSYGAAWAKLFATIAFATFAVLTRFDIFTDWPWETIAALMFGVFVCDVSYVVVLRALRRDRASVSA